MKLTIELVPQTSWYSNVRSNVTKKEWDVLRKDSYKKAGYKCEICSGVGPKHPVECHEIWEYDDEALTQTLTGLISLCPSCNQVKHIGFARIKGNYSIALKHLAEVNGITEEEADKYVEECFEVWQERSEKEWELDITILNKEE